MYEKTEVWDREKVTQSYAAKSKAKTEPGSPQFAASIYFTALMGFFEKRSLF